MVQRDVVVFGGTPAGVVAAVSVAREGASVVLVEPLGHVGGVHTSGVATAEFEHMLWESYGGIALEIFSHVGKRYGFDVPVFFWESKVMEDVVLELLAEYEISVCTGETLESVASDSGRIVSLTTDQGVDYVGSVYVDCSYEGDLLAAAGVSYAIGREDRSLYGESLAGVSYIEHGDEVAAYKRGHATDEVVPISGYQDGRLLPGFVEPGEVPEAHCADGKTSNYHYRVTLSTADDRVPFEQPSGYNPGMFRPYADYFRLYPDTGVRDLIDMYSHTSGRYAPTHQGRTQSYPGDKWEANNRQDRALSLGHVGGQFGYPDASPQQRQGFWDDHRGHNQGLLYFLSHDESVPHRIRVEMSQYGLPVDEYVDNGHWPYALYVREARRMVSDTVMTQEYVLNGGSTTDAIGLASHWIDSHHVQRVAVDELSFRGEGRLWRPVETAYQLPYSIMTPKPEECTNLLVPVCVSASRVAFCSIRVEAQWMTMAEAAGIAATMSLDTPVQELNTAQLQQRLTTLGASLN